MTSPFENESLHDVSSRENPLVSDVLVNLNDRLSEVGNYLGDVQEMEKTTLCIWEGQSQDYRKWDKNYGYLVAPYDGAADTRVRFVDAGIKELVQLEMTAFFGAQPQAIQMGAEDARTAGKVGQLLKYEIQQRMMPELWREFNLLGTWRHTFGSAVMRVDFLQPWTTGKAVLTQEELLVWLMQRNTPMPEPEMEMAGLLDEAAMMASTLDDLMSNPYAAQLVQEWVMERYPVLSDKRSLRVARDLVKELGKNGLVEFRVPIQKAGRPKVKAYCLGVDIFYDWWLDDVRRADVVHCVDCYTEAEIRSMRLLEGWNEDFIEALLKQGPTPAVDSATMARIGTIHTAARSLTAQFSTGGRTVGDRTEQLLKQYQVVRSYVRSVDEDGFPQLHEVVSHPSLSGDGKEQTVGCNRLVDYYDDSGSCFVGFRTEYASRPMWESRGVPELVGGTQWELKKIRDNRMNRSDLVTNPPVRSSIRNEPGKAPRLGIAPGHLVLDGMKGNTEYMTPPNYDADTVAMVNELKEDAANLLGLAHKNLLPGRMEMSQQWMINNFLIGARDVVLLILSMDQQFMDPIMVSRVVGGGNDQAFSVTREEIAGQFDVMLKFDVKSLNVEYIMGRWGVIEKAYANDRSGVMNDEAITRWLLNSIDPSLADIAVGDAKQVSEDEVNDEKRELALAAMKIVIPPNKIRNPQSRLQAIQEVMSQNPTLGPMYQQDAQYREIVDARAAKYQFDLSQRENAQIGREGYQQPELTTEEEQTPLS
jgi:hypothetical protein